MFFEKMELEGLERRKGQERPDSGWQRESEREGRRCRDWVWRSSNLAVLLARMLRAVLLLVSFALINVAFGQCTNPSYPNAVSCLDGNTGCFDYSITCCSYCDSTGACYGCPSPYTCTAYSQLCTSPLSTTFRTSTLALKFASDFPPLPWSFTSVLLVASQLLCFLL